MSMGLLRWDDGLLDLDGWPNLKLTCCRTAVVIFCMIIKMFAASLLLYIELSYYKPNSQFIKILFINHLNVIPKTFSLIYHSLATS